MIVYAHKVSAMRQSISGKAAKIFSRFSIHSSIDLTSLFLDRNEWISIAILITINFKKINSYI